MAKTAFVVDDEENIREIIRCSVESCGLSVCGFEDALQMLNELSRRTPEIIILDIMLPGIDGLEALRRIKSNPATASIPVIMLTAKSSETDKVAGLDLGADDYITKPFGVLELMARIRTALRHGSIQTENNTIFEHRGLVLDLGRHEVIVNDGQIELTLKEFELLKKLMENAGKVILRNTLLDEVWGYGYGGETRTLDMHIRSLRQKLNDDSSSSGYISTVRGVGYKFNS
jgi:two-component system alkaline phosphatase synthesis response regulator PhoP